MKSYRLQGVLIGIVLGLMLGWIILMPWVYSVEQKSKFRVNRMTKKISVIYHELDLVRTENEALKKSNADLKVQININDTTNDIIFDLLFDEILSLSDSSSDDLPLFLEIDSPLPCF
jgi:hypothetical protein